MKTRGLASSSFFDRSMLTTRLAMPSWIAASPMPGASYMVSNMSSTSLLMPESIFWIGSDFSRSLLSGILMISRIAMIGDVSGEQWGVNVERFCRRSIAPSAASGYDRSLFVLSAIRQANAKGKRQKQTPKGTLHDRALASSPSGSDEPGSGDHGPDRG